MSVIRFLHPWAEKYPFPHNQLFSLPRYDHATPGSFGVHHGTALLACQIIANNRFDGFLALDRTGDTRPSTDMHAVLTDAEYYFIVPGDDAYPIVPSFADWEFPHSRLPSLWPTRPVVSTIAASTSPAQAPTSCAVTGSSYAIGLAHLVPRLREGNSWFRDNAMVRYALGTEDTVNLLPLRAEIHRCMDARMWVMAPKQNFARFGATREAAAESSSSDSPQARTEYHVHVLKASQDATEFARDHHNRVLYGLSRLSPEFLLARFAWNVLLLVKGFLLGPVKRRIVRFQPIQGERTVPAWETQDATPEQLQDWYGGDGNRSASAAKRKKRDGDGGAEEDEDEDEDEGPVFKRRRVSASSSNSSSASVMWYRNLDFGPDYEEETRGRPRFRTLPKRAGVCL